MEKTSVHKLAKCLKVLVTITFVCNLIILPLVPGIVGVRYLDGITDIWGLNPFVERSLPRMMVLFLASCWQYLFRIWREPYAGVLSGFLMTCGACTAVILWQARRVLDTILTGAPFQMKNAKSLKRAAVCCFIISGAALVRTVWRVSYFSSPMFLFSYNTLFVPLFAMGGLLCMVMSALFRQAALLKEENDLTI